MTSISIPADVSESQLPDVVYPQENVIEIVPNAIWSFQGSFAANWFVVFSRNMHVVRNHDDPTTLTVINPVRLDVARLAQLDALGRVSHVVRLSAGHAMDDAFYVLRYRAKLIAPHGVTWPQAWMRADAELVQDQRSALPFDAVAFQFRFSHAPEWLLVLRGTTVLACDALQVHLPPQRASWAAWAVMWALNFFGEARPGPFWFNASFAKSPRIFEDYERLFQQFPHFDLCGGAHGAWGRDGHKHLSAFIAELKKQKGL
jgi:hypothetical protein